MLSTSNTWVPFPAPDVGKNRLLMLPMTSANLTHADRYYAL